MRFFTRILLIACATLSFAFATTAQTASQASTQSATVELSRDERWRADVRFYAEELPKRHKNLFFQLSKDEFQREVSSLETRIKQSSDAEIALEIMRITARVGDGHTVSFMPASNMTFYPFRLKRFQEGWFVTSTTATHTSVLGARLVKIGETDVEAVTRQLLDLISADNDIDRQSRLRYFLIWSTILQAKGILEKRDAGKFTFIGLDGKAISVEANALPAEEFLKIQMRGLSDVINAPLASKNSQAHYWFEYLPDARTMYLAYNQCASDPKKPFADFVKELFAVVDERKAERFVIDLRQNSGGNSAVIFSLYKGLLARPQLIEKGKLFVLVANETFSSAFMNALEMRKQFGAVWIGAPPGQRPNAYGEVRRFQLPHSKLDVQYSTKFWELMKGSDIAFAPVDISITPAFADYAQGRDAVLQAALDYKAK